MRRAYWTKRYSQLSVVAQWPSFINRVHGRKQFLRYRSFLAAAF